MDIRVQTCRSILASCLIRDGSGMLLGNMLQNDELVNKMAGLVSYNIDIDPNAEHDVKLALREIEHRLSFNLKTEDLSALNSNIIADALFEAGKKTLSNFRELVGVNAILWDNDIPYFVVGDDSKCIKLSQFQSFYVVRISEYFSSLQEGTPPTTKKVSKHKKNLSLDYYVESLSPMQLKEMVTTIFY